MEEEDDYEPYGPGANGSRVIVQGRDMPNTTWQYGIATYAERMLLYSIKRDKIPP